MISSRLQSASAKIPSTVERSTGQSLATSSTASAPSSSPETAFSIASWLSVPPVSSSSSSASAASDELLLASLELLSLSLSLPHAAAIIENANRRASKRKNALLDFIIPLLDLNFVNTDGVDKGEISAKISNLCHILLIVKKVTYKR